MSGLKINPFSPGAPVPPGTFAGRASELTQIYRCILNTQAQQPQNILIVGERGIGKTSIAHVTKALAEKRIPWPTEEGFELSPMITVYLSVQSNTPSAVVARDIVDELNQQLSTLSWAKETLKSFLDVFSEIKVAGTGFKLKDKTEVSAQAIYSDAQRAIRQLAKKCKENEVVQGKSYLICIILDELDRMSDFDGFSSFWKTLLEKMTADDVRNLMLVCVGMPELLHNLSEDHPSFLRVFTPITLEKMPVPEARQIIEKALKKGSPAKKIAEEAIQKILFYSESYPHLIHEISYSAFEVSEKDTISIEDVENGLHGTDLYAGSVKRLGDLFFSKMFDEVRKSDNYKELLQIIANLSGIENRWVTRQEILPKFSKGRSNLDSCLQQLLTKEVIIRNPDQMGEYRLVSKMFQVYVSKILPVPMA